MITPDLAQLAGIAHDARQGFENREIDPNLLANLCRRYTFIADPHSFVRTHYPTFPHNNCGLATLYLHSMMGGKVTAGEYDIQGARRDHTFLRLDGVIVDITADQFGGPKIYIGPLKAPWRT